MWTFLFIAVFCRPAESTDARCATPLEVWSECDAYCQKTCAEPHGVQPCPEFCNPGCICHDGLVRNASKHCIEASQCTQTSMVCPGAHEVVDRCMANGCQNTCDEPGRIAYCDPYGCSFGCICQKGYMRNSEGVCTWAEDCVTCEDEYARWSNSNATTCENTCTHPDLSSFCKSEEPAAGCVCIEGYLKNNNSKCLPAESCAICDDPNARYSLSEATRCQNTCKNPRLQEACRSKRPMAGCVCKDNLVKNNRSLCIPYSQCDTTLCGINEHYEECPHTCPPEDCESIGRMYKCVAQPPKDCKPKCKCNLNHRRDARGICVPIQQCSPLKCTGLFEVYNACPLPCPSESCEDVKSNYSCNDAGHKIGTVLICRPSCVCLEGYYRKLKENKYACVPKAECFSCNEENEEYREKGPSCEPSCSSLYSSNICIQQMQSGCFCKEGFIRDSSNMCIPAEECYMDLCRANEIRRCGSGCDTTCATLNWTCQNEENNCNRMCYCREGYARDDCGRCIPIKECPAKTGCGGDLNAVSALTSNGHAETCGSLAKGHRKPLHHNVVFHRESCKCIQGYIHDETAYNQCVKHEHCYKCRGPNELWSRNIDCSCNDLESCMSNTANDFRNPEGCRCIDGYVRDFYGICIKAGFCPKCSEMEEYQECGSSCPLTCQNQFQQRLCPLTCDKGCRCKSGYLRDHTGKCIKSEMCPTGCGGDPNASNTTFSLSCRLTCDNHLSENLICDESAFTVGCHCNDGYVYDSVTNLCITPDKCLPGCGGDINAEHVPCGNTCPNTCDNIGTQRVCPEYCILGGGCACKPGFVQGGPFNRCILPDQCPRCREHEIYSCGSACQVTCATLNDVCPIVNIRCNDGCFCNEGYARNAYGRCIPSETCPPKIGCRGDVNAQNASCQAPCSVKCENYNGTTETYSCDDYCRQDGQCVCNNGFILDERSQNCVQPDKCYKCSGNNEVYSRGFDVTCSEVDSSYFEKILQEKKVSMGCHCAIDHVRDSGGVCIPAHLCPNCGSKEVYMDCGSACPRTCENYNDVIGCELACTTGCFCQTSHIRNAKGECVLPEQCDAGCGGDLNASNKTYVVGCAASCDNPNASAACISENKTTGCICNEGYLYSNVDKKCVPQMQCPLGCAGDPNAIFASCVDSCQMTCDNMRNPVLCPAVCRSDKGGCTCKPNYVRNKEGKCVIPSLCPSKKCKKGQKYTCPATCGPKTCRDLYKPSECYEQTLQEILFCIPDCYCKKGYLENSRGDCIPSELCSDPAYA